MRSILFFLLLCLPTALHAQHPLAKFEPPDGFIYHGVGQYPQGVDDYDALMPDSTRPLVVKIYFDIPGTRGANYAQLRQALAKEKGIGRFVELSIGFQDGRGATDSAIATTTQYDAVIDSIAAVCREYGARMIVRPGFEFNGAWFGYRPYIYVTAFRKIVDRFRAMQAADSVAFEWCYYAAAPNDFDSVDANGPRWYPGDNYVDWYGLDLFNSLDFDLSLPDYDRSAITQKGKSERFLQMAREHGKPVLLSETSAKGMEITSDTQDGIDDWDGWFEPFFDFIEAHPEIKGFNYINWDWRAYDTYRTWGNARIDSNAYILARYREEMRRPKYIHLTGNTTTGGLEAPILVLPANGASTVPLLPAFKWTNPSGYVEFEIEVATSISFNAPVLHTTVLGVQNYTPTMPLEDDRTYYWHVRGDKGPAVGPWSETWSFSTGTPLALPAAVRLIAPEDSTRFTPSDSIRLSWEHTEPQVTRYLVEVANNPGFLTEPLDTFTVGADSNVTETSLLIHDGRLQWPSHTWWRVKAANAAGWGPYSEIRLFLVGGSSEVKTGDIQHVDLISPAVAPNPVSDLTTITFTLPHRMNAVLTLHDALGQTVATIADGIMDEGEHAVTLDARNLPAGIYLCRLSRSGIHVSTTLRLVR